MVGALALNRSDRWRPGRSSESKTVRSRRTDERAEPQETLVGATTLRGEDVLVVDRRLNELGQALLSPQF